jgi:hypothetical protein
VSGRVPQLDGGTDAGDRHINATLKRLLKGVQATNTADADIDDEALDDAVGSNAPHNSMSY